MSAAYEQGYAAAIADCVRIAERWRDENRAQWAKALKIGRRRHAFDGDETQLVMAEQLQGAAIECNAIAKEMNKLASVDTLPKGQDAQQGLAGTEGSAVPQADAQTAPAFRKEGEQ